MVKEDTLPDEEEEGDDLPEEPLFLRDESPDPDSEKSMYTKWALMHGKLEDELIAEGANPNTVRICAQELEKQGYRQRPLKPKNNWHYAGDGIKLG